MIIAVDFDGTIVEHRYPAIGRERPFATSTLRRLMKDGHILILWTIRSGKELDEAVEWCAERGVFFHTVNHSLDEDSQHDQENPNYTRKVKADCFIDDCNVGKLLDWTAIYQIISRKITYFDYLKEHLEQTAEAPAKKPWWKF